MRSIFSCVKSCKFFTRILLSLGCTKTNVLRTKVLRLAALMAFCSMALFIVASSAVANTSTGAPCNNCCSNVPDAAVFNLMLLLGYFFW